MKNSILTTLLLAITLLVKADEGMWLPTLLSQLNEKEMKGMGMRITAEDIYSINHSSLKDAIVLFGGGCTGELVSSQGLLLTNHHCGYGNIQRHSTLEHDYLTNGFWAQSLKEELPNPGLSVTFLVSMKEVTQEVLQGVNAQMTESQRQTIITKNSKSIVEEAIKGTPYKAVVKPYYCANQYFLLITHTFNDVRLVGAPPSNIGKFGGDTDNWMWPRHTGDFSVFRIYADKNNQAADYSPDNVPYKPIRHLDISLKGVKENDFTFVYGFPGTTEEYLPAVAVNQIANQRNPIAVSLRQMRLDIIHAAMSNDRLTRIQYANKAVGIANGWKKMIGESKGIQIIGGVDKKQQFEELFQKWSEETAPEHAGILSSYKGYYEQYAPIMNNSLYYTEGLLGIELVRFARGFSDLVALSNNKTTHDTLIAKATTQLLATAKLFYKNYNVSVDKQLFIALTQEFAKGCETRFQVPYFVNQYERYRKQTDIWANDMYSKSIFVDSSRMYSLLNNYKIRNVKLIANDPAYKLSASVVSYIRTEVAPQMASFYTRTDSLQRLYMAAQMQMQPEKRFFPDANLTLRVTYGQVKGYTPADGINYNWFTTLDGIIQKENPDIEDYFVDAKLKELYYAKDYGRYADKDGKIHVAFIASNHTTGGNSGSPVFNADGQLVGINFDRCWEGTMSDLVYAPERCRNISLDIRYCLFIIDKMAGSTRLIEEMSIVE